MSAFRYTCSILIVGVLAAFIAAPAAAEDPPTLAPAGVLAPDGPVADDEFGASFATSRLRCVVGAPGDDTLGTDAGCIYIFHFVDGAWTQEARLFAPGSSGGERFGNDVAIHEGIVAASVGVDDGQGNWDADAVWLILGTDPGDDGEGDEEGEDEEFDPTIQLDWAVEIDLFGFGAPGFARDIALSGKGLAVLSDSGVHAWWIEDPTQPAARLLNEGTFERIQVFSNSDWLLGSPCVVAWPADDVPTILGWSTLHDEWGPSIYPGDSLATLDAGSLGCCIDREIQCIPCSTLPYGSCDFTMTQVGGFATAEREAWIYVASTHVGDDPTCYTEMDFTCLVDAFDEECTGDYQPEITAGDSYYDEIQWQSDFLTTPDEKRRPYTGAMLGEHVMRILMGAEVGTDHTLVYAGPMDDLTSVAVIENIEMTGELFDAGVIARLDGDIAWYLPHPDGDTDWDGLSDLVDACPEYFTDDNADCDGDGVGDACALTFEADQDCNGNDILDGCEIIDGERDCDGNGMPDACEIQANAGLDLNEDGLLDQCCPDVVGHDGDGSYDGLIDLYDLLYFLQLWYLGDSPQIDFDNNGVTDVIDLLILLEGWGSCD